MDLETAVLKWLTAADSFDAASIALAGYTETLRASNCVEVAALGWRSSQAHCVEVALGGPAVGVRDSKDPDGPVLAVPAGRWSAFLRGVVAGGDFDRSPRYITSNSPSLAPSTNASHSDGVKISVSESTGFSELRIAT